MPSRGGARATGAPETPSYLRPGRFPLLDLWLSFEVLGNAFEPNEGGNGTDLATLTLGSIVTARISAGGS